MSDDNGDHHSGAYSSADVNGKGVRCDGSYGNSVIRWYDDRSIDNACGAGTFLCGERIQVEIECQKIRAAERLLEIFLYESDRVVENAYSIGSLSVILSGPAWVLSFANVSFRVGHKA